MGHDDNGIIYDGPDGRPRVYTPSKDREGARTLAMKSQKAFFNPTKADVDRVHAALTQHTDHTASAIEDCGESSCREAMADLVRDGLLKRSR